jgi:nucleotide-binding universal stress UspA family protein
MFRYILVAAPGASTDGAVFQAALGLARIDAAHLVFLHVPLDVEKIAIPLASAEYGGGAGIAELITVLEQDADARRVRAKQAVDSLCARESIPQATAPLDGAVSAEWRVATGDEARLLPQYGRVADLIVLGRTREGGETPTEVIDAALLESGRPLLLVPARPPAQIGRTVAIAWKDTPEAASAVAAALPLLRRAHQVAILTVDEGGAADQAAGARLRDALLWHNRATSTRGLKPDGAEPAAALLRAANDVGADLLVMGGYGHSRFREVVLGGFTRHVLRAAELPVLMAH